jgi:uncharacterized protein
MVCVSYRGYWTSKGRPSEKGFAKDAAAALNWIASQHEANAADAVPVILWGQSIGAGVATNLAANPGLFPKNLSLKTLILETPFTNIRDMLVTIYPQKWLPYRYLWPFLWNHLDNWGALEKFPRQPSASLPEVILLEAGKDELVPQSHGDALQKRCLELGLPVQRHVIRGALHTEIMTRPEGHLMAAEAVRRVATNQHG